MLLIDVGANEFEISGEMIDLALAANDRLLNELGVIAAMKASFETELYMRDKH
jgi:hypothetical protein